MYRPLLRLMALLMAVALVAAACGSSDTGGDATGDGPEGSLLPFSLVQANDFVFEADPTNFDRGIFRVVTTEPMICTIVWGETEDFGNFNNSLAMNGTGIVDHDVLLPGTEAGKTYFFRVQGSTANGDQYRSEVGTFTIPELESGDAMADDGDGEMMISHGDNLALGATVTEVSSIFGNGWEAENAIDGDNTTEWASRGDGDSGFITIDLGSPQAIVGVEFLTRSMLDGTATTDMYTVTIDGGDVLGPFPAGNPANPNFTSAEFTGQVLRFDVESSSGGNVGAIEVRAFAPAEGGEGDSMDG